jgi:hypothetical protein
VKVVALKDSKMDLVASKKLSVGIYDKFATIFKNGEHVIFLVDFEDFKSLGLIKYSESEDQKVISDLKQLKIKGFAMKSKVIDVFWLTTSFVVHSYSPAEKGHFLQICDLEIDLMYCRKVFNISKDSEKQTIVVINPMTGTLNIIGSKIAQIINLNQSSMKFEISGQFKVDNILGAQNELEYVPLKRYWLGFGSLFFEVQNPTN